MPYYPQAPGFNPLPNSITDAQLSDMPDGTVKGRALGAGLGDPTNLTGAQVAALLPAGSVNNIAPLSYRNILGRNGGFEVWQRGAGGAASIAYAASTGGYNADGWYLVTGPACAMTVLQQPGLTDPSRACARIQRNAGQTGTPTPLFEYPFDIDELQFMRGQIVTLSMTLRAGANWSPANLIINLCVGTGAVARRSSGGYTGETTPINATQVITTTATRYSFTSATPVPTNITQASLFMPFVPVGTAGAADYFEIDDVQLEIGSVATPFERRPFESELLACRRHYWKSFTYDTAPAQNADNAGQIMFPAGKAAANAIWWDARHPVEMRTAPTVTFYNPQATNAQVRNREQSLDHSSTSGALISHRNVLIVSTGNAGGTTGSLCGVNLTADAGI